jgi:lysophospholipase L1-like esterase
MLSRLAPLPFVVALAMLTACSEPGPASRFAESSTVVAIGDSIMVGAEDHLTDLIDGIEIDAEVGRPFRDGIAAVERRLSAGTAPDVLVVGLGTNAGTSTEAIDELVAAADRAGRIVFVNVRVPRTWEATTNTALADAASRYDKVEIVDWYRASSERGDLFRTDGYHPNEVGSELWANLIVAGIKDTGG